MAGLIEQQFEVSDEGMLLPKMMISKAEKTFQFDEDAPTLPLPDLKGTLYKYLRSGESPTCMYIISSIKFSYFYRYRRIVYYLEIFYHQFSLTVRKMNLKK